MRNFILGLAIGLVITGSVWADPCDDWQYRNSQLEEERRAAEELEHFNYIRGNLFQEQLEMQRAR